MATPDLGFFIRPDSLDFRDRIFQPTLVEVPSVISLDRYRKVGVPILSQLGRPVSSRAEVADRLLGSAGGATAHGTAWACTGFALSTVAHYLLRRREVHRDEANVSSAMFFEMARRYDDYTGDSYNGSSARGAMKGWSIHGVCRQELWSFSPDRRDRRLSADRAADAAKRPLGAYFRVNHKDLVAMHCALAEVGVLYAVTNVHKGWLRARKDGAIRRSESLVGSHAVAIVAYDEYGFWVQNSWGERWGLEGFGHVQYDDWLKNGTDVWVARLGVPTVIGAASSAAQITANAPSSRIHVMRHLRQHIVRVHPDGRLQSNDAYGTSVEDLVTLFEEDFPKVTSTWKKKRLLLFAGGGLRSLDDAVQREVADYCATLLAQEIYPLSFVWRTGLWDTINTVLRRALSERQHDSIASAHTDFMLDRLDDGIEPRARVLGGKLQWDEVKRTARQATAQRDGAVRLTLDYIANLVRRDRTVEVHVAGHSAGAILLAPAMQLLTGRGTIASGPMKGRKGLGVNVESCALWAPACTTELFHETFYNAIARQRIRRFLLITLTEQAEARDNVAGIYRKSLLRLIANALEEAPRVPGDDDAPGTSIMGLEEHVRNYQPTHGGNFTDLLSKRSVTWKLSPPRATADPGHVVALGARHHGDFDDDAGTLMATLSLVLNRRPKDVSLAIHRSAGAVRARRLSL